MIIFLRVSGIIQRHMIPMFRDPARILDTFYWPLIDLTLFGFMSSWAQSSMENGSQFLLAILTSIACWYIVYRTILEIAKSLLIEMWDNHLANLFASPVSLVELILAWICQGFLQSTFTFLYSLCIIWLIYNQNIFIHLPYLFPFYLLFLVCGWIIGLLIASILLFFGRSAEMITWTLPWLFASLSGAFYPVTLLPKAVQKVCYLFPTTHLFEGVREVLVTHTIPYRTLGISFLLCCLYLVIVYFCVSKAFNKSKQQGLSRLE